MRKSRFSESQILTILRAGSSGRPVKRLAAAHGISLATYYKWRSKYGGAHLREQLQIRELEKENTELRQLYIRQAAEIRFLQALVQSPPRTGSPPMEERSKHRQVPPRPVA